MKQLLLTQLIKVFLSLLNEDLLKKFADMILDFIESTILGTKSEVDDALLLPLISMIRTTFNIKDND